MKIVPALIFLILTSGCVPIVHTYFKPEYQNTKYFGGSCQGTVGAPSVAYFPYEGLFLSVSVDEEPRTIRIGIHIPTGKNVRLLSDQLSVNFNNAKAPVPLPMSPVDLRGGNPDPPEFRRIPSPFGVEDYFGKLIGESKYIELPGGSSITAHKTYIFSAPIDVKSLEKGIITFPDIEMDGKRIKGPSAPFRKEQSAEFSPINC